MLVLLTSDTCEWVPLSVEHISEVRPFNFQITTHLIKFAGYVINFNSFLMCLTPDAGEILVSRAERHAAGKVSPFLAWGDFHARSRFARLTIPEEKMGTILLLAWISSDYFESLLLERRKRLEAIGWISGYTTLSLFSRLVSSPRSPGRRCGLFPTRLCETHSVSLSKATSKMVGFTENISYKHRFSSCWHCSFYHCNPNKTTHWWSFFVFVVILPFATSATIE